MNASSLLDQSNGFIERQIQTIKGTLQKAKQSNTDPDMALIILRAMPIDIHLPSLDLLNMRKMKSNLPIKIRNRDSSRKAIRQQMEKSALQKLHFDN